MPLIDFGDFGIKAGVPDQPTPPIALAGFNSMHVHVLCGPFVIVGGTTPTATLEAIVRVGNDNANWQNIGAFATDQLIAITNSAAPAAQQGTVGPSAPPPGGSSTLLYKVVLGAVYAQVLFKVNTTGAPTSAATTYRVLVNTFNG